jgi:four helix bundle protein
MATIERFEEIEAWKMGRELAKKIHSLTIVGAFARDYDLRSQIRRAAVSITSNIAEGFERDGNKEFLQYLSQAKGSLGEVRSQLYNALDFGYFSEDEFKALQEDCLQLGRLIAGFQSYLRNSAIKGAKYRGSNQKSETRNQKL